MKVFGFWVLVLGFSELVFSFWSWASLDRGIEQLT